MAVDKMVDSSQLDAALTYTANRIRAKSGGSASIAFDLANGKGFGDAVDALPAPVWNWKGEDVEFVGTLYSESKLLKDTPYATWAPSTNAEDLIASADVATFNADVEHYDYLIRIPFIFTAAYPDSFDKKACINVSCAEIYNAVFARFNSYASLVSELHDMTVTMAMANSGFCDIINTNGNRTIQPSVVYGLYPVNVMAAIPQPAQLTNTITIKSPKISARCNASIFSLAAAAAIDQNQSRYSYKIELYRTKPGTTMRSIYDELVDIYHNGL